jgi:hypothetical protein
VDDLFKTENNIQTATPEIPKGIQVQGLALASGLTEKAADGTLAENNTVALKVEEKEPEQAEVLRLEFAMTVNDEPAQPVSPVLITVPFTEAMQELGDDLELVHINDYGVEESINYSISENDQTVSFRANAFSSYVFRAKSAAEQIPSTWAYYEDAPENALLIVAWYNNDGQMVQVEIYEDLGESGYQGISVGDGLTCKVFLLDENYCPTGFAEIR